MDASEKPRISPAVVRSFALMGAGTYGQRVVDQAVEYEKLLVFADSCNISRAAVDAKLLTHSVQQTFDWIASGEAVPLPGYAASQSPSSGLAIRPSMNAAADPPIISR